MGTLIGLGPDFPLEKIHQYTRNPSWDYIVQGESLNNLYWTLLCCVRPRPRQSSTKVEHTLVRICMEIVLNEDICLGMGIGRRQRRQSHTPINLLNYKSQLRCSVQPAKLKSGASPHLHGNCSE